MRKKKTFTFLKKQTPDEELISKASINNLVKAEIFKQIQPSALKLLPYSIAIDLCVLPLNISDNKLQILCLDSSSQELKSKLSFILDGQAFILKSFDASSLKQAIFKAYKGQTNELQKFAEIFEENRKKISKVTKEFDFLLAKSDSAKFLKALIEYAYAQEVSDIHFLPEKEGFRVKLRKDGEFLIQQELIKDHSVYKQIVQRVKALTGLDISKSHLPQDGSFQVDILNESQSVRVSSIPTIHGEKLVLRIFPKSKLKRLKNLGFPENFILRIKDLLRSSTGLIIICGSTGSGKTSTLYALLQEFNSFQKNIVSLEDPVEQEIPGISQTAINPAREFTFASGLRAILRQDPDIILIGEIRDKETFKIALEASLTGHIILTSLHAESVNDIPWRFKNAGIEQELLEQSLLLSISQKLLPKLCENCKVVDVAASSILKHKVFCSAACKLCEHSGYLGRVLLWEAHSPSFTEKELAEFSFKYSALRALRKGDLSYQQVKQLTL